MAYTELVEKSKQDDSYYTITQKGINYRNQFKSFVTMMEKDLENLSLHENVPAQILAKLKTKRN